MEELKKSFTHMNEYMNYLTRRYLEFERLAKIAYHHPKKIYKMFEVLFLQGPNAVKQKVKRQDAIEDYSGFINTQYLNWFNKNYPSNKVLNKQRRGFRNFKYKPKISMIVPIYNTPERYLRECIQSVINQTYPNWELILVDDASDGRRIEKVVREYLVKDDRIKFNVRKKNGHISKASNSCLKLASGEFVGLLDHDDILWPNALFEVVYNLCKNRKTEFIYTDEDKVLENGKIHLDPFFKPGWSPDYLRSVNYISHFSVIKRSLIKKVGGFREGFEGAQDWDLFLRVTEEIIKRGDASKKIVHIPKVLYSWRISPSSAASKNAINFAKKYAFNIQKMVLEDDLKRRRVEGKVLKTQYPNIWRVVYKIPIYAKVSIIIPTKDKYLFIKRCIYSILKRSTYKNFEIVIVDTGSSERKVWNFYSLLMKKYKNIRIINWDRKFNFSEVCNLGVEKSLGEYLIFLNNDTKVVTPNWIENMLEHSQRKEVGIVGVKLLFPNKRIQHAGVVLGISGGLVEKGVAGHPFKNFYNKKFNNGYALIVDAVRNCSAVTAACFMIKKSNFLRIGGFDPNFRIAFNDVDFCLKSLKFNLLNLYTPYAVLYHYESTSVGVPGRGDRDVKEFLNEVRLMHIKWGNTLKNDPYYNKNLTLDSEEYSIAV